MKRHYATIDDILATYSSHISSGYPSPEAYRKNLERILAGKRERFSGAEYITSLERNVVFLHDLVIEGEAFLDVLFDTKRSKEFDWTGIDGFLVEMEERVRARSVERRTAAFVEGSDEEFSELRALRTGDGSAYREKLESTYRHLMTFKLFLFDLFNVVGSIVGKHPIARTTPENRSRVIRHVELTVNFYLGTIEVRDGGNA